MANYKQKETDKLSHKKYCESLGIKVNTKRYRRYANAGLLDTVDEHYVKDIQAYWNRHYNKSIDPVLHLAIYNLTGKKDVRFAPGPEMWHEIIPFFNDRCMISGYKDKNIYDVLITTERSPEVVLKRVRGHYFNTENEPINYNIAEKRLKNSDHKEFIVKPSNTNNGEGIELIRIKNGKIFLNGDEITLKNMSTLYGYNFIVQEVIEQHEIMKKPHPSSVNTLRMVTQRWNNRIHYLLTFARFGAENSVKDNAGTGGVCVGVNKNGEFANYAVDENCNIYKKHPTTDYSFSDMDPIPNFNKYIAFVKALHKDILHMDFVSWDIVVGKDGSPIFLEANFAGATWLYQFATGQPMFGEMTDEILEHVYLNFKINKDIGTGVGKLRRQNKKWKQKNKKSKETIKKLQSDIDYTENKYAEMQEEINRLRRDNVDIINSISWKVTSPIRKIRRVLRKK